MAPGDVVASELSQPSNSARILDGDVDVARAHRIGLPKRIRRARSTYSGSVERVIRRSARKMMGAVRRNCARNAGQVARGGRVIKSPLLYR